MSLNWYKLAQRKPSYTNYGHNYGKKPIPNVMWMIDEDWKLHTQIVDRYVQTHKDWFSSRGLSLVAKYSISQGRYDIKKNIASIGYTTEDNTQMPEPQMLKNINAILNEQFKNPTIMNFAANKKKIKIASPIIEHGCQS